MIRRKRANVVVAAMMCAGALSFLTGCDRRVENAIQSGLLNWVSSTTFDALDVLVPFP